MGFSRVSRGTVTATTAIFKTTVSNYPVEYVG